MVSIKLKELKAKYNNAVKNNKSSFIFKGMKFLTAYAKYFIMNLENKGVKNEEFINIKPSD